jgi:non-specific serine/threonine protein kinase/serine/threonine-protein kinase
MGVVYEAEQEKPVRRKVALKVIKRGMDTKEVIGRFEVERQALAMMDHPSIARVFDAGETPNGRPYFVMECVRGVPITEYCDRHRLTIRERLELFIRVCEGVQHAHQKAIIHRDLKPSNVLVSEQDGERQPKIIDFGVAKATAQRLTERTLYTELGVMIGTPEYMSPEQAEMTGEDVDTRTDVYSLGVMLYELLVGKLPFEPKELREAGFDEIRKRISEDEPSKPSTRLSTLGDGLSGESAKRRRTDRTTLIRQLRGDLDWITMKALEKDRVRRYGSPHELAADLQRHLRNEPVIAGPPGTAYRAGKFVRRHRLGVATASVAVVVLVGFAATVTVLLGRVSRQRDRAHQESEAAQQVSGFLVDLFETSDLDKSGAEAAAVTARELLDRGVERIREELADQPVVRARLLQTMGNAHASMRLNDTAQQLLEDSLSILEEHSESEPLLLADVLHDLASFLCGAGDSRCVSMNERALTIRESALDPNDPLVAESRPRARSRFWKGRTTPAFARR